MNKALINNYLEAFAAANPQRDLPTITCANGWYRISSMTSPVRESGIKKMIEVLQRRVASEQASTNQQGADPWH